MLIMRFVDGDRKNIVADLIRAQNGKFFIEYNPKTSPCTCGGFDSIRDAETVLRKHRPTAKKLNSMCINCTSDCKGTTETVWSGCVWKNNTK